MHKLNSTYSISVMKLLLKKLPVKSHKNTFYVLQFPECAFDFSTARVMR